MSAVNAHAVGSRQPPGTQLVPGAGLGLRPEEDSEDKMIVDDKVAEEWRHLWETLPTISVGGLQDSILLYGHLASFWEHEEYFPAIALQLAELSTSWQQAERLLVSMPYPITSF